MLTVTANNKFKMSFSSFDRNIEILRKNDISKEWRLYASFDYIINSLGKWEWNFCSTDGGFCLNADEMKAISYLMSQLKTPTVN